MPAITYREFGGGLDRRLPIGVQDANRLWTLRNAYITSGKKIAKRPGLRKLPAYDLTGSVGLESFNSQLAVFSPQGSPITLPSGVSAIDPQTNAYLLTQYELTNPVIADAAVTLLDVVWADMFQGFPYVSARYRVRYSPTLTSTRYFHHYRDTAPSSLISDANCPNSASVTKAASRLFAIDTDTVRFCAAGAARDWTTANDAGFLGVSLQQDTRDAPSAVGTFEDALVVFFPEGSQVWDVAVDPSANQLRRRMSGVGTTHPQSLAPFYRDLTFASPYGVRSMSVQETVERIDETDVGVPIDALVAPAQAWHQTNSARPVIGIWVQQLGQYWLIYEAAGGTSEVFAYSFSRSSKLACWSQYTFPVVITGVATLAGKVYVRTASSLYELAADQHTDDGQAIAVDVQMAYQDAKLPGVEKQFYGADYVFSGTPSVSYLYDPRDQTKETVAYEVSGDTRAGTMVPVEVSCAAIAPRFRHSLPEAFTLDMATLYFHQLSAAAG